MAIPKVRNEGGNIQSMKTVTAQELIDILEQVKNKNLPIMCTDSEEFKNGCSRFNISGVYINDAQIVFESNEEL